MNLDQLKKQYNETIMSTEKLKELRIKYNEDIEMRVKLDLLLIARIGQDALLDFWKDNKLTD